MYVCMYALKELYGHLPFYLHPQHGLLFFLFTDDTVTKRNVAKFFKLNSAKERKYLKHSIHNTFQDQLINAGV